MPDDRDDETRSFRLPPPDAVRRAAPPRPVGPRPAGDEPARPRRGRRIASITAMVAVAVAAIAVAVVVGVRSYDPPEDDTPGVTTDTPDAKHPPPRDVTLETCRITPAGAEVSGTVRNPTDDPADYVIGVDLVDPGGDRITGSSTTVTGVPAESRTAWAGLVPAVASTAPSATCKVVHVDRYRTR